MNRTIRDLAGACVAAALVPMGCFGQTASYTATLVGFDLSSNAESSCNKASDPATSFTGNTVNITLGSPCGFVTTTGSLKVELLIPSSPFPVTQKQLFGSVFPYEYDLTSPFSYAVSGSVAYAPDPNSGFQPFDPPAITVKPEHPVSTNPCGGKADLVSTSSTPGRFGPQTLTLSGTCTEPGMFGTSNLAGNSGTMDYWFDIVVGIAYSDAEGYGSITYRVHLSYSVQAAQSFTLVGAEISQTRSMPSALVNRD